MTRIAATHFLPGTLPLLLLAILLIVAYRRFTQ